MIDYSHFTCNSVIYGFGVYAHKPKLQQWEGIKGSVKGENTNKGLYPKNSPQGFSSQVWDQKKNLCLIMIVKDTYLESTYTENAMLMVGKTYSHLGMFFTIPLCKYKWKSTSDP